MVGSSEDASACAAELARAEAASAHAPSSARPKREEAAPARFWFDTSPTATLQRRPGARKRLTGEDEPLLAVKISARERTQKQRTIRPTAHALLTPRATSFLLREATGVRARRQSRMSLHGYAQGAKTRSDKSCARRNARGTKRGVLSRIIGVEKSTIELHERPVLARRSFRWWCRSR